MRCEVGMVIMNANTSSMNVLNAYTQSTMITRIVHVYIIIRAFFNLIHEGSPRKMGHRFQLNNRGNQNNK